MAEPNTELFPGGEPPDRAELIQYLVHTVGLPTSQARDVASRYHEPSGGDFMSGSSEVNWTESRLKIWIEGQPEVSRTGREAAGAIGESFPGARSRAARRAIEDEESSRLADATVVADEAVARASRTRDRFYRAGDMFFDSGPAMDPNALAQSLAVGVFTDSAGNPKIDPETGQPIEVNAQTLWGAIKGQTFDMGALAMPRAGRKPRPRAGREGADDARLARIGQIAQERRTFITPSMAMALLGSMDDDAIIKIQQQLWEAGLFGETPPSWGVADETTRKAYMALFAEASLTPEEPIDRVLARLTDEAVTRGTNGGGTGEDQLPAFKPEVASKESLSAMIDDMAQNLLGRFATDEEKDKLISNLQTKEIETQRAQYDRDVAAATGGGGVGGATGGGIDAFMAAIGGLESGGNYNARNPSGASGKYQIMPSNWGPWAERAGLSRSAPRTPENQEIVARHIMSEYYQRFGNWRDVAIAWFAGPGAVGAAGAESRSDGNLTVREYADRIMARMGQAPDAGAAGSAIGGAIETFDPQAEAQAALKAADPAGWAGHQFANEATEYFGLLQGVV